MYRLPAGAGNRGESEQLVESDIPLWGHRATCKMMPRCWSTAEVLNFGCTLESPGGRFYNPDVQALPQTNYIRVSGVGPRPGSCHGSQSDSRVHPGLRPLI